MTVSENVMLICNEICTNIVLSGGNTMFEGLEQRLTKEIIYLAPARVKLK